MPYILNSDKERREMLESIGAASVEELYASLPFKIRLKAPLKIPLGLSEYRVKKTVEGIAEKNVPLAKYNSFLGAGSYDHYVPAAIKPIISRSEFLTAYTPYQAECSQGILQAIYEYQSYICLLTGMEVSNASLFDGASALAEAVLMSLRVTRRKKIVISRAIHPEYRETLRTYLSGFDFIVEEVDFNRDGVIDLARLSATVDEDTACFAYALPNFFGLVEEGKKISAAVKEKGGLSIAVAHPLSLAILKAPASTGADIACGDGQALGGSLNFGGPSFGFLAAKKEYLRQVPGRIVGKTNDLQGNPCYCLTLQAREQHIRREKATSNICSNHSLNAIAAGVYLALLGQDGLKKAALYSLNLAHYLYRQLKGISKIKVPFSPCFFNEFVWQVKGAKKIISRLYQRRIIAGLCLEDFYAELPDSILSCCTEKKSKEDIDSFVRNLKEVLR